VFRDGLHCMAWHGFMVFVIVGDGLVGGNVSRHI